MNTNNLKLINQNTDKEINDIINEKFRYEYHKYKSYGKWRTVKSLCNWSYACHDTDYIGDIIDDKLYNGRLFNLESRNKDENIIHSFEYMYKNILKVIIEYEDKYKLVNSKSTLELSGPEMRFFIENFKIPSTIKRKQSIMSYLKSFIVDSYPLSHMQNYKFNIIDINIYLEDGNIFTLDELMK